MSAKSTKGLEVFLTKSGATATDLTPVSITSAKPAVVEVADVTGIAQGDIVGVKGTGFPELDGGSFVVGTVDGTGNTFELKGSDTTGTTGTLGTTPVVSHYAASEMIKICLASLELAEDTPGVISVATFCDPSASIPSVTTTAGTLTVTGYVDITDPAYADLLVAVEDGEERIVRVDLPNNGYLLFPLVFSSITWDLPLDGAVGFTATAALGTKARHLF